MKRIIISSITLAISIIALIFSLVALSQIQIKNDLPKVQQSQSVDYEKRIRGLENALHVHEGMPD